MLLTQSGIDDHAQHNTTLIDDFGGLFDNAPTHPLATESGNSVQQEKVVGRKRFEWNWISTVTRPGSRRRKNGQSFVPGEILEKRQLLSDDPITEMNTQLNQGIGTSNAQIDAFFSGGSTGTDGGLNSALGGAAAKFNQLPLNGAQIEDSAIQDVSSKFGLIESQVSTSMNSINSSRPVIAFPESFGIGTPFQMQMPMMMMSGMQMGSRGYSYVNVLTGDYYGTSSFIVEVPSSTPGILTSRLALQGTVSRSNGVVTSNLRGHYMENVQGRNVSYHIEIVNPGSASGKILKFNASQTIGAITTNASVDILDGVTTDYRGLSF